MRNIAATCLVHRLQGAWLILLLIAASLTAMGRLSAMVLVILPIIVALLITVVNHSYMTPLFDTHAGHIMIGVGIGMLIVGTLVLRRLVAFKS